MTLIAEITASDEPGGRDLRLVDDDECFEVEYLPAGIDPDTVLARFGYRRVGPWRASNGESTAEITAL